MVRAEYVYITALSKQPHISVDEQQHAKQRQRARNRLTWIHRKIKLNHCKPDNNRINGQPSQPQHHPNHQKVSKTNMRTNVIYSIHIMRSKTIQKLTKCSTNATNKSNQRLVPPRIISACIVPLRLKISLPRMISAR